MHGAYPITHTIIGEVTVCGYVSEQDNIKHSDWDHSDCVLRSAIISLVVGDCGGVLEMRSFTFLLSQATAHCQSDALPTRKSLQGFDLEREGCVND